MLSFETISKFVEQIRAGHLSGDSHYKRELLQGFVKTQGHEQVSYVLLIFSFLQSKILQVSYSLDKVSPNLVLSVLLLSQYKIIAVLSLYEET